MKKAQYHELNNASLQLHIHPLVSFILGAAMATACILLYISANPFSSPTSNPSPNSNPMELSSNWTGTKVDQGVTREIKEEAALRMDHGSMGQGATNTTSTTPAPEPEVI